MEFAQTAPETNRCLLADGPWDDDLKNIAQVYAADKGCFLVGVVKDEIVAMAALRRWQEGVGEIKRMRIHPLLRRRGCGAALLSRLEEVASRLGYGRTRLDTATRQQAAQMLCESAGYMPTGHHVIEGLDTIVYEKSLVPPPLD